MQIYKITNLINNKIYIGKQYKDNPNYLGSGLLIKKAVNKYGKENFQKIILFETIDNNILNYKEKYYISQYNSTNREIGYNIQLGGEGGDILTNHPNRKEICKKISKSNKNKVVTQETKDKLSKALTGKKVSAKTKKKLSEINKGKNNHNYGKKWTEEQIARREKTRRDNGNLYHTEDTKIKISESLKGKSFISDEGRRKISETHKNKVVSENTRKKLRQKSTGLKKSKETKKKISNTLKNRKLSKERHEQLSESAKLRNKKRWKEVNDCFNFEYLIKLYFEKFSIKQIADLLKSNPPFIKRKLKLLGLPIGNEDGNKSHKITKENRNKWIDENKYNINQYIKEVK